MFTALCAGILLSVTAFAGDPTGTWHFTAEGPNGRGIESTLTLKLESNQLSGFVDNRAGKAPISNAKFADDQISFTVERKIRRQSITVNYAGKLEGDAIKGTIQTTGRSGNPLTATWDATRQK